MLVGRSRASRQTTVQFVPSENILSSTMLRGNNKKGKGDEKEKKKKRKRKKKVR